MTASHKDINNFYTTLFAENSYYSTQYPNQEEASRAGKILEFLSQIPHLGINEAKRKLRILDVGCGRGWLSNLANVYGCCEGIDPVANSIDLAQKYFPNLQFYVGTTTDLLTSPNFQPYDVIITSEVIEHIVDKEKFVSELKQCLVPNGYIIITTPRGEEFKKYMRLGYELQPIEAWISEKDLRSLFEKNSFISIKHDRVYVDFFNDISKMSLLHKLSVNPLFFHRSTHMHLKLIYKGLQYLTGIYQVWLFQAKS